MSNSVEIHPQNLHSKVISPFYSFKPNKSEDTQHFIGASSTITQSLPTSKLLGLRCKVTSGMYNLWTHFNRVKVVTKTFALPVQCSITGLSKSQVFSVEWPHSHLSFPPLLHVLLDTHLLINLETLLIKSLGYKPHLSGKVSFFFYKTMYIFKYLIYALDWSCVVLFFFYVSLPSGEGAPHEPPPPFGICGLNMDKFWDHTI